MEIEMTKYCMKCKENKPWSDFYKKTRAKDGLQQYCKQCASLTAGRYTRKWLYGIPHEAYERMLDKQNNRCAICKEETTYALCVDHDHATGAIRGLLCKPCNLAIANLQDKPDLCVEAAIYLHRNSTLTLSEGWKDKLRIVFG